MKTLIKTGLFAVVAFSVNNSVSQAAIFCVDSTQSSNPQDGLTWATAFNNVPDALDAAATNDEIRIAIGTYIPNATGDRTLPIEVTVNRVKLLGGYRGLSAPGNEDDVIQDPSLTVFSGDLLGDDDDLMNPSTADNSLRVVVFGDSTNPVDALTRIENITITDGNGENPGGTSNGGAGITINAGSNPTIQNCIIEGNIVPRDQDGGGILILSGATAGEVLMVNTTIAGNEAGTGGGLAVIGSDVALETCTIEDNRLSDADNIAAALYGAGFFLDTGSNGDFTSCTIQNNTWDGDGNISGGNFPRAFGGGGAADGTLRMFLCTIKGNSLGGSDGNAARGGGLYLNGSSEIVRCVVDNNSVVNKFEFFGGGIHVNAGGHDIFNCRIINNVAGNIFVSNNGGGGLYLGGFTQVVNTLISHNQAAGDGGGVLDTGAGALTNCTVVSNTSSSSVGGGIYTTGGGSGAASIKNSIVYFNAAIDTPGTVQDQQIGSDSTTPAPTVTFSCVEDENPNDSQVPFGGATNGNIDDVPLFVDADGFDGMNGTVDDNYAPQAGSPVIDRGDSSIVVADGPDVDTDLNIDEDAPDLVLSERVSVGSDLSTGQLLCAVDMGAYERPARQLCNGIDYGDMNQDDKWNGEDIQPFIDCILLPVDEQPCDCLLGNFTEEEGVTLDDVARFARCIITGGVKCDPEFCLDSSERISLGWGDCNNNGIADDLDILTCDPATAAELCDCNGNDIPDGCDITATTSADVNSNNIPDECEPDCNGNNIPDSKDIADATSADCDSNGVPDECDQDCDDDGTPDACETLIDCNSNGIFDACEPDCDNDNVPDACELSGNDCNANLIPDDCEINAPPPFNLADCDNDGVPDVCELSGNDCNSNGILDACDISTGLSEDCNSNGVPDECDIASSTSSDTNSNGIPDECESQQQQSQGGGRSSMMLGGLSSMQSASAPTAATWDEFHEWCFETDFAGMTPDAIFEAIIDKQVELGLPPGQMFPD